jgi:hypothetical protein
MSFASCELLDPGAVLNRVQAKVSRASPAAFCHVYSRWETLILKRDELGQLWAKVNHQKAMECCFAAIFSEF